MSMKTITITACARPHYFQDLLRSLKRNNLDGWRIHIALEPTELVPEFHSICRACLKEIDHAITVNPHILGIRENPFHLLERVFQQGSTINIYLEEDLLVSPDVTALADWFAANAKLEWLCLSLLTGGCGSVGLLSDPGHPDLLFPAKTFNSLGFILTREQWETQFRPFWTNDEIFCDLTGNIITGWDWSIYNHLISTEGLYSLNLSPREAFMRDDPAV
jgi:hypothetical protein